MRREKFCSENTSFFQNYINLKKHNTIIRFQGQKHEVFQYKQMYGRKK
jgi:hypothetical protein